MRSYIRSTVRPAASPISPISIDCNHDNDGGGDDDDDDDRDDKWRNDYHAYHDYIMTIMAMLLIGCGWLQRLDDNPPWRRFMNGKPVGIDTQYVMKSAEEFERYAVCVRERLLD